VLILALVTLLATIAGVAAERRWKTGAKKLSGHMLEVLVFVLMPVIIFFAVIDLQITGAVGAGLAFGWIERIAVVIAAWLIATKLLSLTRPQTGALMAAVAIANTGYLGIPLTALLLGGSHVPLSAAYDNVVNTPAIVIIGFGIGAVFGTKSGQTWRQRLKAFLTRIPPLYALILALLMPDSLHPSWGPDLVHTVAMSIAPIGFFALGVNLMLEQDEAGERVFPPPLTPAIFTALGLRLLLAPVVMLGLSGLLLTVPHAFILEAAMPCGINALVVAHLYGLDMKITVGTIVWSTGTVLGAVTAVEVFGLL